MTTHTGPVIAERDELTVIDCRVCGWAHLSPLPVIADNYYASEFWQTTKRGWLARYEMQLYWLDMRHNDWLSVVTEHSEVQTLLDVGSGYGHFLHEGLVRGWDCYGIEPSNEAASYSDHHWKQNIFYGTWQDFGNSGRFDCISALWLMEHLPNPFDFLTWSSRHLASGGALLLAVPNEWNVLQSDANAAGKCKCNYWLAPSHLNYWNPATFYNLLGRAGFRIVDALATYPMEKYLLAGRDYTADEELGAVCHAEARAWEMRQTRAQRLAYYREVARRGLGRDMVIVASADSPVLSWKVDA